MFWCSRGWYILLETGKAILCLIRFDHFVCGRNHRCYADEWISDDALLVNHSGINIVMFNRHE